MKKSTLASAVLLSLGTAGVSYSAQAALTTSSVLAFTAGYTYCVAYVASKCVATDTAGTYFAMDMNGDGTAQAVEKTAFAPGPDGGIHIGVTQDTNGHASHSGPPHPGAGGIDQEWLFFCNSGMVFTTVPVTVVNDYGTTKELDFSGWTVTWNGIPAIPMGGDPANFPSDTGLATITCSTASCSASSTFTLTYAAHVPNGDPSGFGGVYYSVHMVGHVVPVPAAVWLLGSGLLGLVGVARSRKAARA